jgi:hypothetical protein
MSKTEEKPRLLDAAQMVAGWTGRHRDAVIDEYREAVLKAEFPGPECLEPDELLASIDRVLPEARRAHVETCEPCRELLVAAQPSEEKRREFLDEAMRNGEIGGPEHEGSADPPPRDESEVAMPRFFASDRVFSVAAIGDLINRMWTKFSPKTSVPPRSREKRRA